MAKTYFVGHIRNINGQAVYIVQGKSLNEKKDRNRHIECYREYQNGQALCRNLYYRWFTKSFFCSYPGEKDPYYTRNNKTYIITQEWEDSYTYNLPISNKISEKDIKAVIYQYPDFIYTARKMLKVNPKATPRHLFDALQIWKKHREIEYFFAAGLFDLCFNKSLYQKKRTEQFKICKYVNTHKAITSDIKITSLNFLIKYDIKNEDVLTYLTFLSCNPCKRNLEYFNYLKKQIEKTGGIETYCTMNDIYKDYKKLAKELKLDMTDPYHERPSDLLKRHQKVLEQIGNIKEAERMRKMKERQANFLKAVEKYTQYYTKTKGYEIFIPQNVDEVIRQATALQQCLVYCDYIGKVANKYCMLVFIQKEGNPIATAEILPDGTIGQFRGKGNCQVEKKESDIFYKWYDKHPIKWEEKAA